MGIIEKIEELLLREDMKKSVLCRKVAIRLPVLRGTPRKVPTYPDAYETLKIAGVLGVSRSWPTGTLGCSLDNDRLSDSSWRRRG